MTAATLDRKIVSISSKRQVTIPQKYFSQLGFQSEAEFILKDNELIIRPANQSSDSDFSEYILEDLINEGLSGQELLNAFKKEQKKVRPAVKRMLAYAEKAASGEAEYYTMDDVFGED